MKRVLIIEDDPELNSNIKDALQAEGMQVESVYDGLLAVRLLKKRTFSCIVLDINLPGMTGYQIAEEFRRYNHSTPILMLSAFGEIEDKVLGYERGADDYLTKPFFMRELIMKINSLIKRGQQLQQGPAEENQRLIAGDICVELNHKRVTRGEVEIPLTPREFQILVYLLKRNGELVSKRELIQEIWGRGVNANTNTIEVYINFLRKKIDKPFGQDSIKTKIGYGYYFEGG